MPSAIGRWDRWHSQPPLWESARKKDKETVRLELTPEQKQLIKKQTGKDAEAVELSVSELEERIAPITFQ